MADFNMPPGVSASDIPGNRLEDDEWDEFAVWALDRMIDSELTINQLRRAVNVGLAMVMCNEKARKEIEDAIAMLDEDRMED